MKLSDHLKPERSQLNSHPSGKLSKLEKLEIYKEEICKKFLEDAEENILIPLEILDSPRGQAFLTELAMTALNNLNEKGIMKLVKELEIKI